METENILLSNAENIKTQSIKCFDIAEAIENQRLLVDKIKNKHLEEIVNTQEGSKPKYSNDTQRRIALDKALSEDLQYIEADKVLENSERQLKLAQIELEYQHNIFRANLTIAGIKSKE